MSCIYFSAVTHPSDNQASCHNHTLFTKRTCHLPFVTWHKHYMKFYLLQYVSSDSMGSVVCIEIVVQPATLLNSHCVFRNNSQTVLLHINIRQVFAPHLPLSFSASLQWLRHTVVHLHLFPTVQIMTLEQSSGCFHLVKVQL